MMDNEAFHPMDNETLHINCMSNLDTKRPTYTNLHRLHVQLLSSLTNHGTSMAPCTCGSAQLHGVGLSARPDGL